MKTVYEYRAKGSDEEWSGPYLEEQILSLGKSGIIKADAEIRICGNEQQRFGLSWFFANEDIGVSLDAVEIGFFDVIGLMVKWMLASIPAMLVLSLIIWCVWILLLAGGIWIFD